MKSLKRQMVYFIAALCFLIVAFTGLIAYQSYDEIYKNRENQLKSLVDTAYNIVENYHQLSLKGEMTESDAQNAAKRALKNARYGTEGKAQEYFYIFNTQGIVIMHPGHPDWDGVKNVADVMTSPGKYGMSDIVNASLRSDTGNAVLHIDFPKLGEEKPVDKIEYVRQVSSWGWIVGSGMYTDDLDDILMHKMWVIIGEGLVVILILSGLCLWLVNSVFKAIGGEPREAIKLMEQVSKGHLNVHINTKHNGSLLFFLNKMTDELGLLINHIKRSSGEILVASSEISQGNQDLSVRTEESAYNLQSVASSTTEISTSAQSSLDNTKQSKILTSDAIGKVEEGHKIFENIVDTMDGIKESSSKISEITSVIDGIAFQTNILALNAAVEAARAGEHGKGFAVVAGEVRKLSQQSATAAKEIKDLINSSSQLINKGNKEVVEFERSIKDINDSIKKVEEVNNEINIASEEQSQGIMQIGVAINQLDSVTQQNAALVEEAAAASASLNEQVKSLLSSVERFEV